MLVIRPDMEPCGASRYLVDTQGKGSSMGQDNSIPLCEESIGGHENVPVPV